MFISMLELLAFPFVQRALVAGLILAPLLAICGVIVSMRRIAFLGDGIAHASLAGIALGILTGFAPLPVAILYSLGVALLVFLIEKSQKLATDTILAVLFSSSLALGVILMHFTPGFQPELLSFLFGSILSISSGDILTILALSIPSIIWLAAKMPKLYLSSIDADIAKTEGIKTESLKLTFYLVSAAAIVLSVKMLGVILSAGLLIIPVAASKLISVSLKEHVSLAILLSITSIIGGILISLALDLPSGATIILTSALFFLISLLINSVTLKS